MGRKQRNTDFVALSDDEVERSSRDRRIPRALRRRFQPSSVDFEIDRRGKTNVRMDAMDQGKYRLRTRVRGLLPGWLGWLAPKGRRDCGAHEWYSADASEWRCYHCERGISTENPLSEVDRLVTTVSALRIAVELPRNEANATTVARLVDELDRHVHPLAEQAKVSPGSAADQLVAVRS
jgi:hypothetical protein